LAHASEETAHEDRGAKRIVELGGELHYSPDGLSTRVTPSTSLTGDTLNAMIQAHLIAERPAIESYAR
jgi:bacterioferritin (cytochrome b1)